MSKLTRFLVTIGEVTTECDTAKEVSKLLGRKVTRAQILSCMVPEVSVLDDTKEVVENNDSVGDGDMYNKGTAHVNGKTFELADPLHRESVEETASTKTEEEATEEIEKILDGDITGDEAEHIEGELTEESEEPVVCEGCGREILPEEERYTQDDETILCEECNHDKNMEEDTPGSVTGKTKLEALMEQMRKLNADKTTGTTETAKAKSKGGKTDAKKYVEENNGYPEVGYFKDEKDLKKFYKQLTDAQLDEWLEVEGLSYKPSDNEPINRMRKCMALLYCHFPRESKTTTKSKSKYADYSLEDLLQMALDNNIDVKEPKGTDERILRMYTIMALKKAGVLE